MGYSAQSWLLADADRHAWRCCRSCFGFSGLRSPVHSFPAFSPTIPFTTSPTIPFVSLFKRLPPSYKRVRERVLCQCCIFSFYMVARLKQVVTEYAERLRGMPQLSFGRMMLCGDGDPNRFFFSYLFTDQRGGKTINSILRTTCSRRGARLKASHHFCSSSISSRTSTGPSAALTAPPPT